MSRVSLATFTAVCVSCVRLLGQPSAGPIEVRVQTARSPAEQLARCERILSDAQREPDEQKRLQLVLTVLANLDRIRQVWPDNTAAVVDAGVRQAEVAMEYRMPRSAIEALLRLPRNAGMAPLMVEQRLARAYMMLDERAAAEQHLLSAEKALVPRRTPRSDADAVLNDLAQLYLRTGRAMP